ncbi:MAG: prepilin-type N-terminal cleavage/methylation domain-containing protein [Deltaproteobacteria bacterium]|nr:prepilin-type N-terminal cleavage/methylation domain-containing protein [Deltaproteobacteria bacterium]PWB63347.1 MAG: hypothetical protein C3F14_08240 [Deltaproteobacteria bacterium]
MNRREEGHSLIELMIALAIVGFVLAAATTFFIVSVNQYKGQTKIVATNVEGILGLELLRQDLEGLGFGLPWNNLLGYTERPTVAALSSLEDTPNAPRAVISLDNASFTVNQSAYLVIKSISVGMDNAAGRWTTLTQANVKRPWTPAEENLDAADWVIVLAAGSTDTNRRSLVTNAGSFSTQFSNTAAFVPVEPYSANIIYGIKSSGASPDRPFNRAEYYIANAASGSPISPVTVPQRCAPNTGVLVKAVLTNDSGTGDATTVYPLMDCVADLHVVYGLDTDADGAVNSWTDDISTGLTAADLRARLAEVHVHVLAQEGQRDDSYRHATNPIFVGSEGIGRNFDITGFLNYRWKAYSIVVKPRNLAQ